MFCRSQRKEFALAMRVFDLQGTKVNVASAGGLSVRL